MSSQFHEIKLSSLSLPDAGIFKSENTIHEALLLMQKNSTGAVLVVENNELLGIVSERDLIQKPFIEGGGDYLEAPLSDIMTESPIFLNEDDSLSQAMKVCSEKQIRHVPVKFSDGYKILGSKDILQGVINLFPAFVKDMGPLINRTTTTQLVQYETDEYFKEEDRSDEALFLTPISRIVSDNVVKMDISANMAELLQVMRIRSCNVVVITEFDSMIRGIITERDILLKLLGCSGRFIDLSVSDFMTNNPHRIGENHFLAYAINNMLHFGYRNILVVDSDDYPISVISFVEVIRFLVSKFLD